MNGLRQLADFFDANPDLPRAHLVRYGIFLTADDEESAREQMQAIHTAFGKPPIRVEDGDIDFEKRFDDGVTLYFRSDLSEIGESVMEQQTVTVPQKVYRESLDFIAALQPEEAK